MTKRFRVRRLILVLMSLALLAVLATSLMISLSSGSITRANYDKIEVGTTTLQQVRDLLGTESISIGSQRDAFSTVVFPKKKGALDLPFPPSCQIGVMVDEHNLVRRKWFHQPTAWDVYYRILYRVK